MIKEFIGTGKTIEEATQNARAGLNAPLSADVKIEVIAMPKSKFLGIFGGSDAQVKASYDDGKKERKAPKKEPVKKQAPKAENKPEPKKSAPRKAPAPAPKKEVAPAQESKREVAKSVDLDLAKQYLADIIKGFNIDDAKIDATFENGVITMELECEEYGIVIGRRGETLDSIQYLLGLVMKKSANGYVRVVLNVGNYREKRTETLRNLAKKNASYVLRTGRRYTFEPMNPFERRVIHTTIQEIEGVESRSIGYNQDRRVVIEPVGGSRPRQNNYRKPAQRPAQSANHAPKADRADLPKFGKIQVNKD